MPSLPIVITGTGRSGTTFLTRMFAEAGYDIGELSIDSIGQGDRPSGGGLENKDFGCLNRRILKLLHLRKSHAAVADFIRPLIPKDFPTVIKNPLYIYTFHIWHILGYTPKHIFLCMRNPDAIQDSLRKTLNEKAVIHKNLCSAYAL